jgi:hypothetical protein
MPHPKYATNEIVRRGEELYQTKFRTSLKENKGKYLAIDIESGDYALADEHLEAADKLLELHPGAPIYMKLVGYTATASIGTTLTAEDEESE